MFSFRRSGCLLLAGSLLLSLCGCGASSGTTPSTVSQEFSSQGSVACSIQYTLEMDAVINGTAYPGLRQEFSANADVDLSLGACYLNGSMTTTLDEDTQSATDVESYGTFDDNGEPVSYYRYNDSYIMEAGENSFYSILTAPKVLVLNEYEKSDSTEILFGRECDIYTGSEFGDDSIQPFISGLTQTDLSLVDCAMDVAVHVYHESNLPADFELTYTNLPDMNIQFTDNGGNSYTITSLRYEVIYQNYGLPVNITPPEQWDEYAQQTQEDPGIIPANDAHDEPGLSDVPTDLPEDAAGEETAETYQIYNDDSSYYYEIATPQYMALDESASDYVSFYYPFADDDIEFIDYTVYNDYTSEEEAAYADELDENYAGEEHISNVSSSGLQSVSLLGGTLDVQFVILYMTWDDSGTIYDVMRVYSWIPIPESGGADCLEVVITEYNGSGDGTFIDAVTELEYAYGSILGCQQS